MRRTLRIASASSTPSGRPFPLSLRRSEWITVACLWTAGIVLGMLWSACAYRPPAEVHSGAWRIEPAAADAQAAAADDTAAQVLGWSLGLLGSGAATVPTAAALEGIDADQRALAITSGAVGLAAGAVLLWRWAVLGEVAQEWRLVRDVVARRAVGWEALELPEVEPACTARGCP